MNPDHQATDHNVAAALTAQARVQAHLPAIHFPCGVRAGKVRYDSCSFTELDELSNTFARGLLEYGIPPGARVALMVPPGVPFFALFFALFRAGLVPVLVDPGIGLKSLKRCLDEAAPQAFIGIGRAQLACKVLGWARHSIRQSVTISAMPAAGGINTRQLLALGARSSGEIMAAPRPGEMAAILFTSGSTGIPKGVIYRHRHFMAQVEMLQRALAIQPGEIDLPTFPPFALFDPALGMTTVLPAMDPTQPAKANPRFLVQAIEDFGVTNIFGSPALVNVLGRHCEAHDIRLPSVRRVISAGAAVPLEVIRRMQNALPEQADVFTPYGATECLPVALLAGRQLDAATEAATLSGEGICVGHPVAPNRVAVMAISDQPVEQLTDASLLATGTPGEILVSGPTTTDAYWHKAEVTRASKLTDSEGRLWHRMGDIGYLDDSGRLWFCGRQSQRIRLPGETLFTDQLEAVFNQHPAVARSALVGVRSDATTVAVLCVEAHGRPGRHQRATIAAQLQQMAADNPRTRAIRHFLFHPRFPVDIRHNAKIGREQLATWAQGQMA